MKLNLLLHPMKSNDISNSSKIFNDTAHTNLTIVKAQAMYHYRVFTNRGLHGSYARCIGKQSGSVSGAVSYTGRPTIYK